MSLQEFISTLAEHRQVDASDLVTDNAKLPTPTFRRAISAEWNNSRQEERNMNGILPRNQSDGNINNSCFNLTLQHSNRRLIQRQRCRWEAAMLSPSMIRKRTDNKKNQDFPCSLSSLPSMPRRRRASIDNDDEQCCTIASQQQQQENTTSLQRLVEEAAPRGAGVDKKVSTTRHDVSDLKKKSFGSRAA